MNQTNHQASPHSLHIMIASSFLSHTRALISKVDPIRLYLSIHRPTDRALPPITIFCTPLQVYNQLFKEIITYVSIPSLQKGHRVYIPDHGIGEVVGVYKGPDPKYCEVVIRFETYHRNRTCWFIMPTHFARVKSYIFLKHMTNLGRCRLRTSVEFKRWMCGCLNTILIY
jgi:hypothetical protein